MMGPSCLAPDAEPLADYFTAGHWRADAKRGSRRLRNAILRAHRPAHRRIDYFPRFNVEQREHAAAQIEKIKAAAARYFRLPLSVMEEGRGPQKQVEKRQVAMFVARAIVKASYPDIGKCFGGMDHTTVIHACRMVEINPELARQAARLRARLSA